MYVILEGLHTTMTAFGASEAIVRPESSLIPRASEHWICLAVDRLRVEESTNVERALQGGDRTNPHLTSSDVNAKHILQVRMLG
jgi:hypothetical protein